MLGQHNWVPGMMHGEVTRGKVPVRAKYTMRTVKNGDKLQAGMQRMEIDIKVGEVKGKHGKHGLGS